MFTKEESESARYTLHFLLERLLVLLYPIIPQITSTIAKEKDLDLLKIEWPKTEEKKFKKILIEKIIEFNGQVWKMKKEKGISLKEPIDGVEIPSELKEFEKDLKATHKI
ncbi:MAG: class I tRNA ligase family protein [Nanoarchaeota archaeon]|nr:class I tRNA ligase family protein [Nanoarchaeota archaeon]